MLEREQLKIVRNIVSSLLHKVDSEHVFLTVMWEFFLECIGKNMIELVCACMSECELG